MNEVTEVVEMATQSGSNNLFLTILVLIIAIIFVAEHIKKFRDIFGIKTKWSEHEEEQSKEISELKKELKNVKEEIDEIKNDSKEATEKRIHFEEAVTLALNEIRKDMLDEKIERMRCEILNFASGIKIKDYNEESYSHIFDVYSRYSKIIRDNKMVNGYVDMNMDKIRNEYAKRHNNEQYVEE